MAEISATISQLMNFDIDQMVRSKQSFRRRLAALPIAEKLRLLDAMRERAVIIREATDRESNVVHEESTQYGTTKDTTHG